MTTATGDFSYDFTGSQDPFSNSSFTADEAGTAQGAKIVSGELRASSADSAQRTYRYLDTTFATSGDVTAKIEVASVFNQDRAQVLILGSDGVGYKLNMTGFVTAVYYTTDFGETNAAAVGDLSDGFTAGDVFSLTLTRGTPNTLVMRRNGSVLTPTSGGSTHTATLASTLYLAIGLKPESGNATGIGSFAMDNILGGAPVSSRGTARLCLGVG